MPFTGPTEDRLAIRELYGSYADAACAGDGAAWLALWADDCTWDTALGKVTGKQALKAQWDGLWSRIETMTFFGEVASIEADGDRARSRAYCREVSRWKDGNMIKVIGRYDDELVRRDGTWKFVYRKFTLHLKEE